MIRKSRVVIEQPIDDTTTLEDGVVVQTVSPLQEIQRTAYLRIAHDWFENEFEQSVDDFLTEFGEQLDAKKFQTGLQTRWDTLRLLGDWATFMCATTSVVQRTTNGKGPGEWEISPVPESWQDFETCVNDVPSILLTKAMAEIHRLNPNLWVIASTDEEKKIVRVSETM